MASGDGPASGETINPDLKNPDQLANKLKGHLHGPVLSGDHQLAAYATDFGGLGYTKPALVVKAVDEHDLLATLEFARTMAIPVTVRGSGCSCNGQSLSNGGILICYAGKQGPISITDDKSAVEVLASQRWQNVDSALRKQQRRIPVLADNLSLTVGGILSVGGYGIDSLVHGPLVSQVRRLKLIRPNGEVLWCSEQQNTDLYRYSLAGLGQLGIITRAEVNTVRRSRFPVHFSRRHKNLRELVQSLEGLRPGPDKGPDFFKAFQARGKTVSVFGRYTDSLKAARSCYPGPAAEQQGGYTRLIAPWHRRGRSLAIKLWVARYGPARRLWSDFLVDYHGLSVLVDVIENLRRSGDFDDCLKSIYILAIAKSGQSIKLPLEASSGFSDPVNFGIGLYSMIPRNDKATLARTQKAVAICLEACLATGGRPYLYGWHEFTEQQQRQTFGADYGRLQQLRRQGDPDGIFRAAKVLS